MGKKCKGFSANMGKKCCTDCTGNLKVDTERRNMERFPINFCFQLTSEEFDDLRSQIATANTTNAKKRFLPYVFTEQGIAMLSVVLKSPAAVEISISIMNAFVKMRRHFSSVSLLSEKLEFLEAKQIQYQRESERKFDEIFSFISAKTESQQKNSMKGDIRCLLFSGFFGGTSGEIHCPYRQLRRCERHLKYSLQKEKRCSGNRVYVE